MNSTDSTRDTVPRRDPRGPNREPPLHGAGSEEILGFHGLTTGPDEDAAAAGALQAVARRAPSRGAGRKDWRRFMLGLMIGLRAMGVCAAGKRDRCF